MGKIISAKELSAIRQENKNQKIVLTGGVFDILHEGHIDFLTQAKRVGEILIVLVESDRKIKELKGQSRPKNNQQSRVTILSNLPIVDFVYPLPYLKNDLEYEAIAKKIEPDIIAFTPEDRLFNWEKKYKIRIIERTIDISTTDIINKSKVLSQRA